MTVEPGEVLWSPTPERIAASGVGRYLAWLEAERGLTFADHRALWRWSVEDLDGFWGSIWDHVGLGPRPPVVLADDRMPGAVWFPGVTLNWAEQALAGGGSLVAVSESRATERVDGDDLRAEVARVADGFRTLGVGPGDVVAGYLPHGVEAVVALLATAALGAVWTACPPDYGVPGTVARLRLVAPKVIVGVDGYRYRGRVHDRLEALAELHRELAPAATVVVPHLGGDPSGFPTWSSLGDRAAPLTFAPVPFDHPLWILWSSGTTGVPKAIVQGHGGITVEHLKALSLQHDIGPGDRMVWYTSTGWMMWNLSVSALMLGATVVAYDGDPRGEDGQVLWRLIEEERATRISIGAPLVTALANEGFRPAYDTSTVGCLGATGAPLPPHAAAWVYDVLPSRPMLAVGSGGTDVCTAFVGPSPLLPVRAGRMAGPALGCAVAAFDDDDAAGRPVPAGQPGELVVTRPMPSMPLRFWGDDDGERYRSTYFDRWPGVWHHGDRIVLHDDGSNEVLGRSDATLNRGGVRLGTADLYSVLDRQPGVADSLVVHLDDGRDVLVALVVLDAGGCSTIDDVAVALRTRMAAELSPRHVPDEIIGVRALPRTITGKRLEVPVKRILSGVAVDDAVDRSTVADADALDELAALAVGTVGR